MMKRIQMFLKMKSVARKCLIQIRALDQIVTLGNIVSWNKLSQVLMQSALMSVLALPQHFHVQTKMKSVKKVFIRRLRRRNLCHCHNFRHKAAMLHPKKKISNGHRYHVIAFRVGQKADQVWAAIMISMNV